MEAKTAFIAVLLLLCSGCTPLHSATTADPSQLPTLMPSQSTVPTESFLPTPELSTSPIVFPYPSSELFGLEGVDAVLYDAVVEYYCGRGGEFDFSMPSLSVLDGYDYPGEDGATCYICWFRQFDYYGLGQGLSDLEKPTYTLQAGGCGAPARFTISTSEDGKMICTNIMEVGDGEGMFKTIDIICGPHTELATAIKEGDTLPVEMRDLTPSDPVEMLDDYLDYFFRD